MLTLVGHLCIFRLLSNLEFDKMAIAAMRGIIIARSKRLHWGPQNDGNEVGDMAKSDCQRQVLLARMAF